MLGVEVSGGPSRPRVYEAKGIRVAPQKHAAQEVIESLARELRAAAAEPADPKAHAPDDAHFQNAAKAILARCHEAPTSPDLTGVEPGSLYLPSMGKAGWMVLNTFCKDMNCEGFSREGLDISSLQLGPEFRACRDYGVIFSALPGLRAITVPLPPDGQSARFPQTRPCTIFVTHCEEECATLNVADGSLVTAFGDVRAGSKVVSWPSREVRDLASHRVVDVELAAVALPGMDEKAARPASDVPMREVALASITAPADCRTPGSPESKSPPIGDVPGGSRAKAAGYCESEEELERLGKAAVRAYLEQLIDANIWRKPQHERHEPVLRLARAAIAYLREGQTPDLETVSQILKLKQPATPARAARVSWWRRLVPTARQPRGREAPPGQPAWTMVARALKRECQSAGFEMPPIDGLQDALKVPSAQWQPGAANNRPVQRKVWERLNELFPRQATVRVPQAFAARENYAEHLAPLSGLVDRIELPAPSAKTVVDLRVLTNGDFPLKSLAFHWPGGTKTYPVRALVGKGEERLEDWDWSKFTAQFDSVRGLRMQVNEFTEFPDPDVLEAFSIFSSHRHEAYESAREHLDKNDVPSAKAAMAEGVSMDFERLRDALSKEPRKPAPQAVLPANKLKFVGRELWERVRAWKQVVGESENSRLFDRIETYMSQAPSRSEPENRDDFDKIAAAAVKSFDKAADAEVRQALRRVKDVAARSPERFDMVESMAVLLGLANASFDVIRTNAQFLPEPGSAKPAPRHRRVKTLTPIRDDRPRHVQPQYFHFGVRNSAGTLTDRTPIVLAADPVAPRLPDASPIAQPASPDAPTPSYAAQAS